MNKTNEFNLFKIFNYDCCSYMSFIAWLFDKQESHNLGTKVFEDFLNSISNELGDINIKEIINENYTVYGHNRCYTEPDSDIVVVCSKYVFIIDEKPLSDIYKRNIIRNLLKYSNKKSIFICFNSNKLPNDYICCSFEKNILPILHTIKKSTDNFNIINQYTYYLENKIYDKESNLMDNINFNFFEITGLTDCHFRSCNLLGWLFDKNETHNLGSYFFEKFLYSIKDKLDSNINIEQVGQEDYSVEVKWERIDIECSFVHFVILGLHDNSTIERVKENYTSQNKDLIFILLNSAYIKHEKPNGICCFYKAHIFPILNKIISDGTAKHLDFIKQATEYMKQANRTSENGIKDIIIQQLLSKNYNVSSFDLVSNKYNRNMFLPRQIYVYFLKIYLNLTFEDIAKKLNKQIPAILYMYDQIKNKMSEDEKFNQEMEILKQDFIKECKEGSVIVCAD